MAAQKGVSVQFCIEKFDFVGGDNSSKMGIFSEIPRHNRMDILKKLDFKDFVKFKQCSQETMEIAKNFRHRLPLKIESIKFLQDSISVEMNYWKKHRLIPLMDEPIRFETQHFFGSSNESEGSSLEQFCKYIQPFVKVEALHFSEHGIEPATIRNLIQLFNVENLFIWYYSSADLPELLKMKELSICTAEMRESDFLLLEAENIDISRSTLTLSSVNKFLKQWVEGKRKIQVLKIDRLPKDHLEMLSDIVHTVHFSPGMKEFAIGYCKILNVYSITREDEKKLFISIQYYEDNRFYPGMQILATEWDGDFNSFMRENYYLRE